MQHIVSFDITNDMDLLAALDWECKQRGIRRFQKGLSGGPIPISRSECLRLILREYFAPNKELKGKIREAMKRAK